MSYIYLHNIYVVIIKMDPT